MFLVSARASSGALRRSPTQRGKGKPFPRGNAPCRGTEAAINSGTKGRTGTTSEVSRGPRIDIAWTGPRIPRRVKVCTGASTAGAFDSGDRGSGHARRSHPLPSAPIRSDPIPVRDTPRAEPPKRTREILPIPPVDTRQISPAETLTFSTFSTSYAKSPVRAIRNRFPPTTSFSANLWETTRFQYVFSSFSARYTVKASRRGESRFTTRFTNSGFLVNLPAGSRRCFPSSNSRTRRIRSRNAIFHEISTGDALNLG